MITRIARIVSILLHPLMMPTYGMLLLFSQVQAYFVYTVPPEVRKFVVLVTLLNTFLLPSLFLLYLIKRKKVTDIEVSKKEERWLPLLFTTVLYTGTYYVFKSIGISPVILLLLAGAILSVITAFFINLFWKISMHMVGIGGLIGVFYGMAFQFNLSFEWMLVSLVLAAGVIGYSRVHLEQHTSNQTLAGLALGFSVSLIVLLAGLN